jgi:hypothetical protein
MSVDAVGIHAALLETPVPRRGMRAWLRRTATPRGGKVHGGKVHDRKVHDRKVHDRKVHDRKVHDRKVHGRKVHGRKVHDRKVHDRKVHDRKVHDGRVRGRKLRIPMGCGELSTAATTDDRNTNGSRVRAGGAPAICSRRRSR